MCNYLSTYIPCLSDITTTLRQLNKKSVEFVWNSTYEKAFRLAKLHVMNAVTLQYFDPWQPIVLECDASGKGVGGTLLQNGQPIIFISQALTDTQKRYSNIERELLAMVVVIEKLHHYVLAGILQFTQIIRPLSICSQNVWMILHHSFNIYYYVWLNIRCK